MVAEFLRHRAAREGPRPLVVESAGLLGIEGEPASPEAVDVLRAEGVDLSGHRSRGLGDLDLRSSNLVVVMTRAHAEEIERRFHGLAPRVELLRAFEHGVEPDPEALDLDDPIGRPEEAYRECFRTIRPCVHHLLLHLRSAG